MLEEQKLQKKKAKKRMLWIIGIAAFVIIAALSDQGSHPKVKKEQPHINDKIEKHTPQESLTTDSINADGTVTVTEESAEDRQEKIKYQFSPWSGAHIKLERYIKGNMNDPDSYEHIETTYSDKGSYLIVVTKFRGKNSFGGKVINYVKAKVDLDGNVIKIIDNE
ncbi:hypothetical protein GCM10022392_26420 [Mucilaginibacter panaciglaebae]|uniref:Uncharacterized protein n=2 Tax=Mucilaginibacter panaciglaebae TaxID=502331 RepID=A0ABP7WZ44_9SPHI